MTIRVSEKKKKIKTDLSGNNKAIKNKTISAIRVEQGFYERYEKRLLEFSKRKGDKKGNKSLFFEEVFEIYENVLINNGKFISNYDEGSISILFENRRQIVKIGNDVGKIAHLLSIIKGKMYFTQEDRVIHLETLRELEKLNKKLEIIGKNIIDGK